MADPAPARPKPPKEPRALFLLLFTLAVAAVGAASASLAVAALFSFLPSIVGVALGLLLGLALPLVLALRANAALLRRGYGAFLRGIVVLFLLGATQLALVGAVLQWTTRTTGHMAWAAVDTLDTFAQVPVLSNLLRTHAERRGALPPKPLPLPVDGGVPLDGGSLLDGGVAADAGIHAPVALPGDATAQMDAGPVAPSAPDALALPAPRAGVGLSPRTAGKRARTFAVGVETAAGAPLLVVGNLSAGGTVAFRVVDLSSFDALGPLTQVEAADDGTAAAILGGAHLVVAKSGERAANAVAALAPGQKVAEAEVRAVRDVALGPSGHALAVVEIFALGKVMQALVALPPAALFGKAAPVVLRKSGDAVPGVSNAIAHTWAFKKSAGGSAVLVNETYLEGGTDVGFRISAGHILANPQRLLSIKADAPKQIVELARTGMVPSGVETAGLQLIGDAWALADGRVLFDAALLEGTDGWLFVKKPDAGIFALAPEHKAAGDAPWSTRAPRAQHLEVSPEGNLVFRRADGALISTALSRVNEARALGKGADALTTSGQKRGSVVAIEVPVLGKAGAWLLASARVAAENGTHEALLLASRADLDNGKAEVLLEAGSAVPGAPEHVVQRLLFFEGRDELLW